MATARPSRALLPPRRLRHDDLRRDVRARRAHRRDQPRPGLPRQRRAARDDRGGRRRDARRAQPVPAGRRASPRCAPRSPSHQRRFYGLEFDPDGEVLVTVGATEAIAAALLGLCEPGDEVHRASSPTTTPTPPRWRWPARRAAGHAAPARLPPRPRRAGRRGHAAHAAASCSTRRTTRPARCFDRERARGDRRALPRARPARGHRRGLRAPRLRRRARPAGGAAGDGRADADDLLAGKTFSFTGWKVGWACGPRRTRHGRAHGQAVPHLHGGDAAAARGAPRRSRCPTTTTPRLAADLQRQARPPVRGPRGAGLEVFRPAGTYFVNADVARSATDGVAFCRSLPERAGVVAVPTARLLRRPGAWPLARALRVLQARRGDRRGSAPARRSPRVSVREAHQRRPPARCCAPYVPARASSSRRSGRVRRAAETTRAARAGSGTSGVRATFSAASRKRAATGRGAGSGSGGARCSSKRSSSSSTAAQTSACGASSPTAQASRASASGSSGRRRRTRGPSPSQVRDDALEQRVAARCAAGRAAARAHSGSSPASERARSARPRSSAAARRRAPPAARSAACVHAPSDRQAVGRVARPHDLPAGTSANSAIRSAGVHHAVSMNTFGWSGSTCHSHARSEIAAVGEDEPRVGELARQLDGVAPERRDAAAGVDQDRHARARGRRATSSRTPGSGSVNCSARGCSLMPTRAGVQAARAPRRPRRSLRVDAGRTRRAGRRSRRGRRDRDVVGRRVAVGLVHREHDGARVRAARARRISSLGRLLEAVGVVCADVRVRVEELERAACATRMRPTRGAACVDVQHRARHPTARAAVPDTGGMHFRRERVRIETARHEIEGTLQLPHEGFRSRTDRLPQRPRATSSSPLTDAERDAGWTARASPSTTTTSRWPRATSCWSSSSSRSACSTSPARRPRSRSRWSPPRRPRTESNCAA